MPGIMVHSKEIEKLSKKDGKKGAQHAEDTIHHFEIHPAEGGHVIEHHYSHSDGKYKESTRHIVKSHAAMAKHMNEHCESCGGAAGEPTQETEAKGTGFKK